MDNVVNRNLVLWVALGWIGYLLLPWYAADGGFWTFAWLFSGATFSTDFASGLIQSLAHGRAWLLLPILPLIPPLFVLRRPKTDPRVANIMIASGIVGIALIIAQGFTIGISGWEFPGLEALFGPTELRQAGMGYGALALFSAYLFIFTLGIAARGAVNGDVFVVGSIGLVVNFAGPK